LLILYSQNFLKLLEISRFLQNQEEIKQAKLKQAVFRANLYIGKINRQNNIFGLSGEARPETGPFPTGN